MWEVTDAALCASATNRRAWGDGLHHVLDARTGQPVRTIAATWAVAPTAMRADALATALFFDGGPRLAHEWGIEWVRMTTDGRVEWSPGLPCRAVRANRLAWNGDGRPSPFGRGTVVAVARDDAHRFSKPTRESITLVEGFGVEGDAHAGATVQHLSRVARDPSTPNLRQVHLIHSELFAQVAGSGHLVRPGELGENVTTAGIDLLALSRGTRLELGDEAVVEITGLRNPCNQINGLSDGLMKELVHVDEAGEVVRLAGVMSIVVTGGVVSAGDPIRVVQPATFEPLGPV